MIRTQLHAVSTTAGAGEVLAQLPINIVIRHMANSLLYIAGLSGGFLFPFRRCDAGSGGIFDSLLIGFGFRFISTSRMA
ncbi:TPA: hypothetical protein L9T71_004325 [Klebsiella pneumoniae]|nr:hypothetical protein [Klebsiella variicola]MCI8026272.1 hypothetical protein [Klebsiella pneumoniae]HBR2892136.1 hypothetical protein [Klebsiella pneumoniae]HBR3436343.1 hypothetical protein [Klebsiella pneumoniae]HBR3923171.1 hypothetical protein [Klebsiella pneumoniae]